MKGMKVPKKNVETSLSLIKSIIKGAEVNVLKRNKFRSMLTLKPLLLIKLKPSNQESSLIKLKI